MPSRLSSHLIILKRPSFGLVCLRAKRRGLTMDGEKQMTVTADYVLQGVDPKQIATAPFDVQVVETANDSGVTFTAAQVKQMESGGSQVLGYFSLGEAENYRDYFQSLSKSIVGPQDPSWPGNYEV